MTRKGGPLALSGGLVATLVVLIALAATEGGRTAPDQEPLVPGPAMNDGVEYGTPRSTSAPVPMARVAVGDPGPFLTTPPSDADRAAAPQARPAHPKSTGDWAAYYGAFADEVLADELATAFGPGGLPNQRVGLIGASIERDAEVARPVLLAAAAFAGDVDRPRAVSLASYTLMELERRSDEPGFRAVLADLAWDPTLGFEPRLRGRAAAHLVRTAAPEDVATLRTGLYGEQDAHVAASATAALGLADPQLRDLLADLCPGAGPFPSTRAPREP